jgi:hypothetical protein
MRYLNLLLVINAGGVIVLHLGRCREIKAAPLRTPSSRSAIGSASTDSASRSSPASRLLPDIPAEGNSKIKNSGLAEQQKLSTRAASFAGGLAEPKTLDLTWTSAKLTRQRSSREATRSRKDADGECLFQKIDREGGLAPRPRAEPDDLTVHEKKFLKKIVDGQDRICPKTGKNWSKEWREQQQVWIQSAMKRPLNA